MSLIRLMAAVRTSVSPAADRDSVLDLAAGLLACRQVNQQQLLAELHAREAVCSTAIGHGVAIPHGRCAGLSEPRGAMIRLPHAVDFGNNQQVDLVFAMAVPAADTEHHLQLLAALAQHFSDPKFRLALRQAENADALLELLSHSPSASESRA